MVQPSVGNPSRYWIGTVPILEWLFPSPLPTGLLWIRGQQELSESGYHHVQCIVGFGKPVRRSAVTKLFRGHWERTRSAAADEYVWKDDTRIPDTQFELGTKPLKRNSSTDWEAIRTLAKNGTMDEIPADVYIRSYFQLRAIAADNAVPIALERTALVFWGPTGTGKSRRAWDEAGIQAYAKDPRTKWWCGYQGQENVVIDEFRGDIAISHILRWLDRYPVTVETKGGSRPLAAKRIWITSNLSPSQWYLDIDVDTREALNRRLTVINLT